MANIAESEIKDTSKERRYVIEQVFSQYDTHGVGELTPVQVQILHGDLRMGGISLPQVV